MELKCGMGASLKGNNLETDIARIEKRVMKIICPGKTYEPALIECGIKTLKIEEKLCMCINLIKNMNEPLHKLNGLLPPMVSQVRERDGCCENPECRNITEYHGICRNITEYGGISRNITTFSRNIPEHYDNFRW